MTPEQIAYKATIKKVAEKHNLPYEVVDRTYHAYWKFVRHSLSSLPLKEALTEEEFGQLRTSVNIPSLGKFSCDYECYTRLRKRLECIKKLKEYDNKEN